MEGWTFVSFGLFGRQGIESSLKMRCCPSKNLRAPLCALSGQRLNCVQKMVLRL